MAISKRTILSLILSVTTIASFAQSTLTGKVIDSETGEALIASTVRVMSTDTTRMIAGNATTKDGAFTIKSVKDGRSEEHTSELQSHSDLVCRLLLEKRIQTQDEGVGKTQLTDILTE